MLRMNMVMMVGTLLKIRIKKMQRKVTMKILMRHVLGLMIIAPLTPSNQSCSNLMMHKSSILWIIATHSPASTSNKKKIPLRTRSPLKMKAPNTLEKK